jgi:sugar phosphate isomerase/epimerase
MIKFGLKVYGKKALKVLGPVVNEFDFIEIMALENVDYKQIKNFGLPVIIHNKNSNFGINFANPLLEKENKKSLDLSIELANKFDSKFIIVHPEFYENPKCSEEQTIKSLNEFSDDRILIENMPGPRNNKINFGDSFDSIKHLCDATGKRLCLDIAHAALSSKCLNVDVVTFLKQLNSLNPGLYHFSDVTFNGMKDHLDIGTGELNWQIIVKELLKDISWVIIESSCNNAQNKLIELKKLKRLV